MPAVAATPNTALDATRLEVLAISKRWSKTDPALFTGLDLELASGALAVIEGRNGVGKTTLLRIVAGMIAADEGTVQLEGLSPRRDRREYQRRVGFLSAGSTGLYGRLTVLQHLDYWARLSLLPTEQRESRIAWALTRFELEEIAERRANRMSMGQRQRLTLALTFLHAPSLVLLDEPWNSLDGPGIELANAATTEFVAQGGAGIICVPTGHELELVSAQVRYALEDGELRRVA